MAGIASHQAQEIADLEATVARLEGALQDIRDYPYTTDLQAERHTLRDIARAALERRS